MILAFFRWENWANIEKRLPEAGYQTAIPKQSIPAN